MHAPITPINAGIRSAGILPCSTTRRTRTGSRPGQLHSRCRFVAGPVISVRLPLRVPSQRKRQRARSHRRARLVPGRPGRSWKQMPRWSGECAESSSGGESRPSPLEATAGAVVGRVRSVAVVQTETTGPDGRERLGSFVARLRMNTGPEGPFWLRSSGVRSTLSGVTYRICLLLQCHRAWVIDSGPWCEQQQ